MIASTRRAALGAILAASSATVPAVAAHTSDAALIALGRELERLWAHERAVVARFKGCDTREADEAINAACSAAGVIADQISASTATTLAGLNVKARAFAWCRCGETEAAEDLYGPDVTTDQRIMVGIVVDLLREDTRCA